MFLHLFRYQIISTFRDKASIFWRFAFPIILGTLMYAAFGGISENEMAFRAIPVAVVTDESNPTFESVLDEISSGDEPLLSVTECTRSEADELLKNGSAVGIISISADPSLTVAEQGLKPSILRAFLDEYRMSAKAIEEIAVSSPEKLPEAVEMLRNETEPVSEKHLTDGNNDPYVCYFYNVIAMSVLYSAFISLEIASRTKANMSPLGARCTASPVTNLTSSAVCLLAETLISFVGNVLALLYFMFVIKINFSVPFGYMLLMILAGVIAGLSIGYLIGSVFTFKKELKYSLMVGYIMLCCFLSGLMYQGMRQFVEEHCSFLNRINPAGFIADSFYALNIYGAGERFRNDILSLIVFSAAAIIISMIFTRRQSYADL